MVEEKRGKTKQQQQRQQQTLYKEKQETGNVRKQRDKGWIQVIRVHDTTHIAVTTTLQGSRRSRTTPHTDRLSGLVKPRDYPHHLYIVNERRYNPRYKKCKQREKTVNGKNRSLARPQTLTQGGHEIASVLN